MAASGAKTARAEVKPHSEPAGSVAPASRSALRAGLPWFGVSALLFSLTTYAALTQQPHPDALRNPSWLSAQWWLYPIETNALKRLPRIACDLNAVDVDADGRNVYVAGNLELLIHSPDGGRSWRRLSGGEGRPATSPTPPTSAAFRGSPFAAWAQGKPTSPPPNPAYQSAYPDAAAVDPKTKVDPPPPQTRPRRNPPSPIPTPIPSVPEPPKEVDIDDWIAVAVQPDGVYLIGRQGKLRVWRNGALHGTSQATPGPTGRCLLAFDNIAPADFKDAACANDGRIGWAVGPAGIILNTADGGSHWYPQTQGRHADEAGKAGPYSRSPAPWYYLSSGIWLLPIVALLLRTKEQPRVERSVADVFVSDRPLEVNDPDPLQLHLISGGLSRFLRNRATRPPLTIGVIGEWGTGKSSLMNLLRSDLVQHGWRPVWFNAWHHQKEEHLLAALLQTVKLQAVPDWWTFDGIRFLVRLQWAKGQRQLAMLGFWLALSLGVAGFLHASGLDQSLDNVQGLPEVSWHLALEVFPLLGSVWAIWKRLTAFGVNPASLLASTASGAKAADLEAQTSLRHRFATDFCEVTHALGDQSLIVFIDDLDRCSPDHVLEVLEAVNFLVSSGDCYVILGMARDKVEACVGLGFEEIAREMAENTEEDAKTQRQRYAAQYLDKLINIEVPIPIVRPDQSLSLLTQQRALAEPHGRDWKAIGATATRAVAWGLILAGAIAFYQLGDYAGARYRQARDAKSAKTEPASATVQPQGGQPLSGEGSAGAQPPAAHPGQRAELIAGASVDRPSAGVPWAVHIVAALLAIQFLRWRRERANVVTEDSPEFVAALERWHEVIYSANATPRAHKRFLNRVRYLAMRQQEERAIPEPALVALAATQLRDPELRSAAIESYGVTPAMVQKYLELTSGIVVR